MTETIVRSYYMDQQSQSLPPSQIDKNMKQLAKTIESIYGNPWGIIWRNFLAGFMRVTGMICAYIILVAIFFFVITKTGILTQIQGVWKNITNDLITNTQKNMEKSLFPKLPINQNSSDQEQLQKLIP